MIIGCSHGTHLAKKVAKKAKLPYSELNTKKFPDGELYVKFQSEVKGKNLIFVQSFYDLINDCLTEVLFAAFTAKELGAKKLTLVAPYFPYLRQDKRFHKGETVSSMATAALIDKYFDKVMVMDPHLHRKDSLHGFFKIHTKKLTANNAIGDYIQKNIKNAMIVGPDWESYKWAEVVGKKIGYEHHILHKKRWSSRKVKIYFRKGVDIRGKKVIVIDDIISSGHTLLETIKNLKGIGVKKIVCICVHGIFAENALTKLKKTGATILCTNTIPNAASKIDVSSEIAKALKR